MKILVLLISIGCIVVGGKFIHENMNAEFVPDTPNKVLRYLRETAEIVYTYETENHTLLRKGDYWIKPLLNSKHAEKARALILGMDLTGGNKKLNRPVLYGDSEDRSLITKVYDSWSQPVYLKRKEGKTYLVSGGKDGDIETGEDNISNLDEQVDTDIYPEPFMRGNRGVVGLVMCVGGGLLFLSFLIGLLSKKS